MGHVRDSFYVDAPPEEVWAVGADPARLPEWNVTVVDVKDVSGPLESPGARYTTVSKIAGRPLEITWTVERAERPKHAEATATTPLGGSARQVVDYSPEGKGTRVSVDIEFEISPGLLGQIVSKVFAERSVERDIKHSGENFKALVEELQRVPVG
jgi:acetyl-CoA C-acetyltransferase